ncbi:MAG: hypothetical protein ABW004_12610 [Aeromicrobium sp.]
MTSFDTTGPVELIVDSILRSDIRIVAGDDHAATVDIRPRDPQRPLDTKAVGIAEVDLVDGILRVRLRPQRRYSWFTDGGAVDIDVRVPIGSRLHVESGMGAIVADGEFAAAWLRSGMGDLRVDQVASLVAKTGMGDVIVGGSDGDVVVGTGGGLVRIGSVGGALEVRNSNGSTEIDAVGGPAHVRSSNGSIDIGATGSDVTAKSANGSIRVAEVVRGSISASTSTGAIDIGVKPGAAVWLQLDTKQGRIINTLDAGDGPAATGDTVEVRARSSYSDVTIHRSTEGA